MNTFLCGLITRTAVVWYWRFQELVNERVSLMVHAGNLLWHLAYPIVGIWMAGDNISIRE